MSTTSTTRAAVAIAMAGISAPAAAQTFQQLDYSVSHTFTFTAATSATVVDVRVTDFRHAWARGAFADASFVAGAQDPNFDPYGFDTFLSPASINSGLLGAAVTCVSESYVVSPAGLNAFVCTTADGLGALAAACNEWAIDPFPTAPYVIHGIITSSGGAMAGLSHSPAADAYAFSSTGVFMNAGIQLANGTIRWGVTMDSDSVGGGAGASARVQRGDPVHLIATNLDTGEVVDAVLLDVTLDVAGPGRADWSGGVFEALADEVSLAVSIPGTFVAPGQSGRLELRVQQGVVTVSDDDGIFDGVLPPAGTVVPFAIPLPGSFTLDYDLGLDPAHPWDVTMVLSGGGSAHPRVVCPADLDGNGVLNVDDVDAFILLFLEGDLAADLNGDEVLNIDDVDAFIAAFLGGCDDPAGVG